MDDLEQVRETLQRNANLKWGFVIYRCTYDNDKNWARFVDHLNTRVRLNLEEDNAGNCLVASIGLSKWIETRWRAWAQVEYASKQMERDAVSEP